MKKIKIQKTQGIIFRVYFEYMYEQKKLEQKPDAGRAFACTVIAKNAQEAMGKAKAAYPKEVINSIHSDRGSFMDGPSKPETIIL